MKKLTFIIALGCLVNVATAQTTAHSSASSHSGKKAGEPDAALTDSIVNDLFKLGIIQDQSHVSFNLDSDVFRVNNKEQSTEILDTFKKKYHIVRGYSIAYAKSKGSISTSIIKEN